MKFLTKNPAFAILKFEQKSGALTHSTFLINKVKK